MYLVNLIYTSKISFGNDPKVIERILESSQKNNPNLNITGILCFNRKYFLQSIEGSRNSVNQLFNKISKDERHSDILILDYKEIQERSFESWSMAFVPETKLAKDVILKYSRKDEFDPYEMSGESAFRLLKNLKNLV